MPMRRSSLCYRYSWDLIHGRRDQSRTGINPASELHPHLSLPYHRTKRPDTLTRWFSFRYRYSRTNCAHALVQLLTATPIPIAPMHWSSTSSHSPISQMGIHVHSGQSRPNSMLTFIAPIHMRSVPIGTQIDKTFSCVARSSATRLLGPRRPGVSCTALGSLGCWNSSGTCYYCTTRQQPHIQLRKKKLIASNKVKRAERNRRGLSYQFPVICTDLGAKLAAFMHDLLRMAVSLGCGVRFVKPKAHIPTRALRGSKPIHILGAGMWFQNANPIMATSISQISLRADGTRTDYQKSQPTNSIIVSPFTSSSHQSKVDTNDTHSPGPGLVWR
ncbi:hypothetical protein FA13DRAFT_1720389 [Coprinellus micaceus]|uniref:Uncharacterized protein n=1 Tax=Coprinellus micaceus TaxID=71717 RepID=A0A4Y7S9G8_COPMI|nr:hypothetical protein FA13DRAFT_1720389 [Coprinellus micaceus]